MKLKKLRFWISLVCLTLFAITMLSLVIQKREGHARLVEAGNKKNYICYIDYWLFNTEKQLYEWEPRWHVEKEVPYDGYYEEPLRCPKDYKVVYIARDGDFMANTGMIRVFHITSDTHIEVLLCPTWTQQTYDYYLVNPENLERRLLRSVQKKIRRQGSYRLEIEEPVDENMIVKEVLVNGAKVEQWEKYVASAAVSNRIEVLYYPISQKIYFHENGGSGEMEAEEFYFQMEKKLPKNVFFREGYKFEGWSIYPQNAMKESNVLWEDEALYTYQGGNAPKNLDLYAVWRPAISEFCIEYVGEHEGVERCCISQTYGIEEEVRLWDKSVINTNFERGPVYLVEEEESAGNSYELTTQSTVIGWALKPNEIVPDYKIGEEVYGIDLVIDALKNQAVEDKIKLYAVWDDGPKLIVPKVYVCKADFEANRIDGEFLLSLIQAYDERDGILPLQKRNGQEGGIYLEYYGRKNCFLSGEIVANAVDSAGNKSSVCLEYHILDEEGCIKSKKGHVRFIAKEYLNTLKEDSIWRTEVWGRCLQSFLNRETAV